MANPNYEVVHSGEHDEEWLALRRLGVGASESPILTGLSTFRNSQDIYADKLGIGEDVVENEHMIIGSMAERTVLKIFQRLSGHTVGHDQRLLRSKKWPWLQATPDGAILDENSDNPIAEVVETKVTSIPWSDGLPKHVWGQVQHQMAVMGLGKACAVALHGSTLPWIHVERDDQYIEEVLVPTTEAFWAAVEAKAPYIPERGVAEEGLAKVLNRVFAEVAEGATIHLDGDWLQKHDEREDLVAERKRIAERLKEIENDFRLEMKEAEFAALSNGVVYSLKPWSREAKTIERKASSGRTLRCSKKGEQK